MRLYREVPGVAITVRDRRVDGVAPSFVVAVPAAVMQKAVRAAQDQSTETRAVGGYQREQIGRDRGQIEQFEASNLRRHAGQDEFRRSMVCMLSFLVEVNGDCMQVRKRPNVFGVHVERY